MAKAAESVPGPHTDYIRAKLSLDLESLVTLGLGPVICHLSSLGGGMAARPTD